MLSIPPENEILARLTQWGQEQPLVRAMLLTSTRAVPRGAAHASAPDAALNAINYVVDELSDYDVILAVEDIEPFYANDRAWLADFGTLLVRYRDPLTAQPGGQTFGLVTQYEDGLKIDFSVWDAGVLCAIAAAPSLPPEFDAGYRVLLDKDGLTAALLPPTYRAYIPTPPDADQYFKVIEEFFLDCIYVAKYLWRGDLLAARHVLNVYVTDEHLRPMLEWRGELHYGWALKPGPYGRRIQKWLPADLYAALESTWCGPGLAENWTALYNTIALFRRAAGDVAAGMGFTYPAGLDARVMAHLEKIHSLRQGDPPMPAS